MAELRTLDSFVTQRIAPLFRDAGFTRKGRLFLRTHPPLIVGAKFLYRRAFNTSMRRFDIRMDVAMPAYSDRVALLTQDLSMLTGQKQPDWQWPLERQEDEVVESLRAALAAVGFRWCDKHSSLEGVRETLEESRPCLNRSCYLSHVYEQMGNLPEALFWWEEYCRPDRPDAASGSPARERLERLRTANGGR